MPIENLESYFSSGARSAGQRFFNEDKVSFSRPSDTEILAYVKPNLKLVLKSASVSHPTVQVTCTCPDFKKGRLCKHAWAALQKIAEESPDFLEGKKEIATGAFKAAASPRPKTRAQINSEKAFKEKQAAYRKEQYQKQKQRLKEIKASKKKTSPAEPSFPKPVQAALSYFLENGFDFKVSMNEESISRARKKLSRIFHPDIGGSHQEILELNKNTELLLKYVISQG